MSSNNKELVVRPYQAEFIDFLVQSGALTFGDFTTKSGRKTPYFVNTGNFNTGSKIAELGRFYAAHIVAQNLSECEVIFGPAYKGIPLCVSTCAALALNHKINLGYAFDRKEVKDHGDGGKIVGHQLKDGDRVVLVEDVVTAGTTLREIIPFLTSIAKIQIRGVVVAVDRCERGQGQLSAVQEASSTLGLQISPIVTIHHILNHLSSAQAKAFSLTGELKGKIEAYLEQYGA